ncbi:YceI family protein [Chitinophaga silvatica]|uniref:YceI family protein n=1 Tax=Chitinophaga silvatica TaxID=2282649 RepID=A0A3E1Y2H6_9BACT|nr:YceI family protein [Chitinophaga silvatica]RFS18861.1 YceI family protein [Chitinophaga silvatica]
MIQKIYSLFFVLAVLTIFSSCSRKDSNLTINSTVDESLSSIKWTGSAPTHSHEGAFKVSGSLQSNKNSKITGGSFTIPIGSITNFDLTDEALKEQLLEHLLSDEFFDLVKYPEAKLVIKKVEEYSDAISSANTMIIADFTMLGQTHSINIPALVKGENGKFSAEGSFKINRLNWGMNSFNDPNGTLYILPDVEITLDLYFK